MDRRPSSSPVYIMIVIARGLARCLMTTATLPRMYVRRLLVCPKHCFDMYFVCTHTSYTVVSTVNVPWIGMWLDGMSTADYPCRKRDGRSRSCAQGCLCPQQGVPLEGAGARRVFSRSSCCWSGAVLPNRPDQNYPAPSSLLETPKQQPCQTAFFGRFLFQVREVLTAKDSWGRTLVSHGILSGNPQVFEVTMSALRVDVLDEEVRECTSCWGFIEPTSSCNGIRFWMPRSMPKLGQLSKLSRLLPRWLLVSSRYVLL